MMDMFHNAFKLAKIDDIFTRTVDVEESNDRQKRLPNTRMSEEGIQPLFNRIILRDEKEEIDTKTPPTPTTRPQVGQKRILTGRRRRKPSKIRRKPLVAIQMSTPPIRTLPPQIHRFIQHSTTVAPATTPIAVKRLPSFKPQNLPSRQRIRVKIPKNTSLPIIRQPFSKDVSPSKKPQIPSNPFIKTTKHRTNNNHIRQKTTPTLFTRSQTTSPPRFIFPLSTLRPFIGTQSSDTNHIPTNTVKSLSITKESFLKSEPHRLRSNLRSQGQIPPTGQIISSKPFDQFKKFKKNNSNIKLPHKSAIKSLPSKTRNVIHHLPRHPLPSRPHPTPLSIIPVKPFKPSPKIIEGNFVPSTQAWTTKTGVTKDKVVSGRRPPVVPRVPIIPKTKISKFISTNGISDTGEKYRKGKDLNDSPGVTNNKELLSLYSRTTNFQCANQEYPGLYADLETNCQTFHMCQVGGRQNTFICPVGTLFDQRYLVCNWSNRVNCRKSVEFYKINRKIYEPTS